ncbi:MAG: hypothetical protein ACMUIL_05230 [bacterium]
MSGNRCILTIAVMAALSLVPCGRVLGTGQGERRVPHEGETHAGAFPAENAQGIEHHGPSPLHGEEVHHDGSHAAGESSHGQDLHRTQEGERIETAVGQGDAHSYHAVDGGAQHPESEDVHGIPAGDGGHGHEAEAGTVPLVYLLYWGLLILIMVVLLIYFVYRVKRSQSRSFVALAAFLTLFAVSVYLIEIFVPAFSGRFDPGAMRVIHEFHEGNGLGFLRFFYKFLLGILLSIFALLNVDSKKYFR